MKIEVSGYTADIRLKKGVYVYDADSATGKTFLAKLLHGYSLTHNNVLVLSYPDYDLDKLNNPELELVIVDRGDLFLTKEINHKLNSLSCVVLVDAKLMPPREGLLYHDCVIEMCMKGFSVYDPLCI